MRSDCISSRKRRYELQRIERESEKDKEKTGDNVKPIKKKSYRRINV